ncbi:MAG TPA: class I SAM-dependent methyltransferase [Candidatus Angelobacter sp.]|jgi:cyclopropane fatty-acyl-phospholipid synthase-like methyltransferase
MSHFDTNADPFEKLAADYDRQFTSSFIGSTMRRAVWKRFPLHFTPGQRILELNCGTGEDAVFLARQGVSVLATDASRSMIDIASAKVRQHGLEDRIRCECMGWDELDNLSVAEFDGAFSNFGGLNCVKHADKALDALARRLRPHAHVLLCVMGPWCPWEWIWYLVHGDPARAFRRFRSPVQWRGIHVSYPSLQTMRWWAKSHFTILRVSAIGVFVPPSYTETWALRHARLIQFLNRCERRLEAVPPLPWFADHYVIELSRLPH